MTGRCIQSDPLGAGYIARMEEIHPIHSEAALRERHAGRGRRSALLSPAGRDGAGNGSWRIRPTFVGIERAPVSCEFFLPPEMVLECQYGAYGFVAPPLQQVVFLGHRRLRARARSASWHGRGAAMAIC